MKMTQVSYDYDLYEVLGVHPRAPEEVIRAAYKVLIAQAHPDKGGSGKHAVRINRAKEILLNHLEREKYDEFLREQHKGNLGNYQVLEQIGEGAFGRTYKARHVILKEMACLKQNINATLEDVELLTCEAKLLWAVHHHSLPTLRDFFKTSDGNCVIAMTYIDGVTIDKIVQKHGGIDPEHVCWMTQRLLNALNYLHAHGIVHCDVKPNNIIVKPEEHNAILVDYGFASLRPKQQTKPGGYTEAFAAPELIYEKPPLPQTDLYSLAMTMMYALGGNPIKKTYPLNVPSEMSEFFNKFLSSNPLHRPDWEKNDLVKELSDLRVKVFGRKQSNKELKV